MYFLVGGSGCVCVCVRVFVCVCVCMCVCVCFGELLKLSDDTCKNVDYENLSLDTNINDLPGVDFFIISVGKWCL